MAISTILLIVAGVILFLGLIVGFSRGIGRSTIGLLFILIACIVTFVFSIPVAEKMVNEDISPIVSQVGDLKVTTVSDTVTRYVETNDSLATLVKDNPTLTSCINMIPIFLLSIVLFYLLLVAALLVSALLYVIFQWPIMKIATKKIKKSFLSRLAGCGIGAVAALLILGTLFAPILGFINSTKQVMNDADFLQEINEDFYQPITKNQVVNILNKLGFGSLGEFFLTKASSFEDEQGNSLFLMNEINSLADIYSLLKQEGALEGLAEDGLGAEKIVELLADPVFTKELMRRMLKSNLLVASIPQIAVLGAKALATSLALPASNEDAYDDLSSEMATLLNENSNEIELAYAYDQYLNHNVLSVDEPSAKIISIQKTNVSPSYHRFRLTENGPIYIVDSQSKAIGKIDKNNSESKTPQVDLYSTEAVKQATEDVRKEIEVLVSSSITVNSGTTKEMIQIASAGIVKSASEQIAKQSSYDVDFENRKLTSASLKAVMNSDNISLNEIKENTFSHSGITGDALARTFHDSIFNLISKDKNKAADTLADLIIPIAETIPSLMNLDNEKSETKSALYIDPNLGSVISVIRDDESLNGMGSSLIDALSQSKALKEVLPQSVTDSLRNAYEDKNADIGKVASAAIAAADMVLSANNPGDEKAAIKSVEELILNLDESTLPTLLDLLSLDLIRTYVPDNQSAETAKGIIDSLLTLLAKETNKEDYKTDAEAILGLYTMATNTTLFTDKDLILLSDSALKSKLLMSVLHSCNTYRISLSNSQKASFILQLQNAFKNSSATTSTKRQVFNDIALILDLNISF